MSSLQDDPNKNPTPDTSPVQKVGDFTTIDLGTTDLTPEEIEEEFANNDPKEHAEEYTYHGNVLPGSSKEKHLENGGVPLRTPRLDAVDTGE